MKLDYKGLKLHIDLYEKGKDHPCIIFIPGMGSYAGANRDFLAQLHLRGYNVAGVDLQGHGRSEGRRGDFTMEELAGNVSAVIDYVCSNYNPRIGVLGTSFGGLVALITLINDNRVKSAISHAFPNKESIGIRRPHMLISSWLSKWVPGLYIDYRRFAKVTRIFDDPSTYEELKKDELQVWRYTIRALHSLSLYMQNIPYERITTPLMILVGERDRLCSPESYKPLLPRIKGEVELKLVPGVGHAITLEYIPQVLPVIDQWFRRTL